MKWPTDKIASADDDESGPPPRRRFRFRIRTLLVLIAIVAGSAWLMTQANMQTAEFEILQYDATPVGSPPAEESEYCLLHHIKFRWRNADHAMGTATNWFLNPPVLVDQAVSPGSRFQIRYRARALPFLPAEAPEREVARRLGVSLDQIEEVIVESTGQELLDNW